MTIDTPSVRHARASRAPGLARAFAFGAGFAPLVALTISSDFGLAWVGVYLLSGAICTMAALWLDRRLEARYG